MCAYVGVCAHVFNNNKAKTIEIIHGIRRRAQRQRRGIAGGELAGIRVHHTGMKVIMCT